MKCSVLFLALLLPACASISRPNATIEKATGAAPELRKSDAESRPAAPQQPAPVAAPQQPAPVAAPQPPAPVEAQQSAPLNQADPAPKKKEHNIEED